MGSSFDAYLINRLIHHYLLYKDRFLKVETIQSKSLDIMLQRMEEETEVVYGLPFLSIVHKINTINAIMVYNHYQYISRPPPTLTVSN